MEIEEHFLENYENKIDAILSSEGNLHEKIDAIREIFVNLKETDQRFCQDLTRDIIGLINLTRIDKEIKGGYQQEFYKYFNPVSEYFINIRQKIMFNGLMEKLQNDAAVFIYEQELKGNLAIIQINYSERKAQKLADLCQRIVAATRRRISCDLGNLLFFFLSINIQIDLSNDKEPAIVIDSLNNSRFHFTGPTTVASIPTSV